MLNNFLTWFLNTMGFYFEKIINLITTPILNIINDIIPNFTNIFSLVNNFFESYFFNYLKFVKMAFINIFHINHEVFTICMICFIAPILIFFATRSLKLGLNLWRIYKSGATSSGGKK